MADQAVQIGDLVTLYGKFTAAGAGRDPATVRFKLKKPAGAITTYTYGSNPEVRRTAAGYYELDFIPANGESGQWSARIEGVGTYVGAEEISITVDDSQFD